MKIAVIAPSIYMSEKTYPERIFAPRVITLQLVEGFVKKGHQVTLFSAPDIETEARLVSGSKLLLKGDLLRDKYLTRESLFEYKLQSAIESQHLYSLDIISMAYQEAQKSQFDIIHTDDSLVHAFVNLTATPTVFVLHDPLPREKSLDYWFLNRYKDHNFISISLAQKRGEPALNFVGNVYHGIKVEDYEFSCEKGNYLAFMGRFLSQKGPDLAIEAAKKTNENIILAGDETHFNTRFVKEKVLPNFNNDNIMYAGFFSVQDKKNKFLKEAKAFLFPINWEEPFGLVMIEAMACGTPVIAYNRGSVPEVVRDGVTGFVIDPDNEDRPGKGSWVIKKQGIEGLVEAVRRMGQIDRKNCRRHVEGNFTVEQMVENYEKVYQKVLASQGLALRG